jgi:hypothetical protein
LIGDSLPHQSYKFPLRADPIREVDNAPVTPVHVVNHVA